MNQQQNVAIQKRTSHFYKKRLEQKQCNEKVNVKRRRQKIAKKPKSAKLRAKQARQRKKQYVQKLQFKIKELENYIEKLKAKQNLGTRQIQQIQSSHSAFVNLKQPQKMKQSTETKIDIKGDSSLKNSVFKVEEVSSLCDLQNSFLKLYKAVHEQNQQEAGICLAFLRDKFGVAGQQRIQWIQQMLHKLIQTLMPMHCRFLLQNCQNRDEFYVLLGGNEGLKPLRKLNFDTRTKNIILSSRPAMMQVRQEYIRVIGKMHQLEQSIVYSAKKFQREINRLQQSLSPLFVAKILTHLDVQRRIQNFQQIFPINFYQKNKAQIEQMRKQQERMQRFSHWSDDYQIFDELFNKSDY